MYLKLHLDQKAREADMNSVFNVSLHESTQKAIAKKKG